MKILVTGVSGSLASVLVPLLLDDGHEIIGVSRGEYAQSKIERHPNLTLYLCDIRNRDRMLEASRGCDLIIHLAAMKRIECCEQQPEEAIGINVLGTENVLFCQRINKIPRVTLVSSDKGCNPILSYGFTKALAECLVARNPNNVICRYGNVISSRGSVLHSFIHSLKTENKLRITDKRMTRFFWTLEEAASFVYRVSMHEHGGLKIPDLKAYPVVKMGMMIANLMRIDNPEIEEIGFRCKEKLHEQMRTADEGGEMISGDSTLWFRQSEMRELLLNVTEGML